MEVYVDQKWKFVGSTINMMEDEIKLLAASGLGLCAIYRSSHTLLLYLLYRVLDVAQVSTFEYFTQ
jgi:hypothetical protein